MMHRRCYEENTLDLTYVCRKKRLVYCPVATFRFGIQCPGDRDLAELSDRIVKSLSFNITVIFISRRHFIISSDLCRYDG